MRKLLVAGAMLAVVGVGGSVPAFAADVSTAASFTCNVTASVTRNGTQLFATQSTFRSSRDVSVNYTNTYTVNGSTFIVTAVVSCHQ
jgi:hypothetical protein